MNLEFSSYAIRQFQRGSLFADSTILKGTEAFRFPPEARVPFSEFDFIFFLLLLVSPLTNPSPRCDLLKIKVRVKGMKIGMNAEANFFYSQAVNLERRTQGDDAAMVNYMKAEVIYLFMCVCLEKNALTF